MKVHRGAGREWYSIVLRRLAHPQIQKNHIQLGDLGQKATFLLICDVITTTQVYGAYTLAL